MNTQRHVAYYRVSTARQGQSGLGLDAQRHAVAGWLADVHGDLVGSFTEIESGAVNDREQLGAALNLCRMTGATLVIAKLDRLSRDAHFLIGLSRSSVKFIAVDMPSANELTVGIMALVAQEERKAISARTTVALAAAKARGVKLGGWRGGPKVNPVLGAAANTKAADDYAATVGPMVTAMRRDGLSLRQIAASMTAANILTARGGQWSACAVSAIMARAERLKGGFGMP